MVIQHGQQQQSIKLLQQPIAFLNTADFAGGLIFVNHVG